MKKQKYVIVYNNGCAYEDYESFLSEKTFASREKAEEYLDDNGYNYDEYDRKLVNYSKNESERYAFIDELKWALLNHSA